MIGDRLADLAQEKAGQAGTQYFRLWIACLTMVSGIASLCALPCQFRLRIMALALFLPADDRDENLMTDGPPK